MNKSMGEYLISRLQLAVIFTLWMQVDTVAWGQNKQQQTEETNAVAEEVKKNAECTESAEGKENLVKDETKVKTDESGKPVIEQKGEASFYGKDFHGKETASGEKFDQHDETAAHPTLPLGSEAEVTNLDTGKSVEVEINDRGPYAKGRDIDLSKKAAKEIGIDQKKGVAPVQIEAKVPPNGEGKQGDGKCRKK